MTYYVCAYVTIGLYSKDMTVSSVTLEAPKRWAEWTAELFIKATEVKILTDLCGM